MGVDLALSQHETLRYLFREFALRSSYRSCWWPLHMCSGLFLIGKKQAQWDAVR